MDLVLYKLLAQWFRHLDLFVSLPSPKLFFPLVSPLRVDSSCLWEKRNLCDVVYSLSHEDVNFVFRRHLIIHDLTSKLKSTCLSKQLPKL